jgi:hypothetical protein
MVMDLLRLQVPTNLKLVSSVVRTVKLFYRDSVFLVATFNIIINQIRLTYFTWVGFQPVAQPEPGGTGTSILGCFAFSACCGLILASPAQVRNSGHIPKQRCITQHTEKYRDDMI